MPFVIHSSIYSATEVGQNLSLPCRLGQAETGTVRERWEGHCCPACVAVKVFEDGDSDSAAERSAHLGRQQQAELHVCHVGAGWFSLACGP